ncbi:MAG TPA: asparagine synthase (glutamine-hydrolyzing) [Pyrinomonadaceae bacterium]|nr:asparagine synthase (glutamine-hydrolyzing) [Pyrinomonadaceae bacterium]
MCGIAGIIGNRVTEVEARLARMSGALVHRGPDDEGVAVWPGDGRAPLTAFGHRRLSIIDLSAAGHQPMSTPDGRFSIIYNGELYNYRELRRELHAEGVSFVSHTDTEVLLQLYARRGADCLQWLRGMFAFAVRDNQTGAVFIARDHLGIKPLYYYHREHLVLFASELRALLESDLVPRRLNSRGLTSYLQSGSVAAPGTMIEGVALLRPGHYLTVVPRAGDALEVKEISYTKDWLADSGAREGLDRPAAVEALRDALKESVRLHLVSDVPLAPFLSGGIDSSAIVALMSQVTGDRPKTFSVVFDEQKFSEAPYARCVAEKFKTEHHEIRLSEQRLYEMLPAAVAAVDQPTMDGINTFVVSKAVKDAGITVALSGLGGDELFAGYPTFRRALRMRSLRRVPNALRKGVSAVGARVLNSSMQQRKLWQLLEGDASPAAACEISRQLLSEEEIELLLADGGHYLSALEAAAFADIENGTDTINSVSLCELRGYMANTLLRDTDCMSMAHSLEVRVPFVDVSIVKFVLSLPGAWKLNGGRPKPLLQDALGDLLPTEITNRPKMGFTLPFENWMQSRLRDEINGTFEDERRFESMGFRPGAAHEIWQRFLRAPQSVGWSRPWALYVLAHWCAQHQVTL